MAKIIPGILTADENDYVRRLKTAEQVADLIQIDVVDGQFAKNMTVGAPIIAKYPTISQLEIQLMVVDPISYINQLGNLPYIVRIIAPLEVPTNFKEVIYTTKKFNKQVGLSLNPDTPVLSVKDYFDHIDLLSLYAGRPGFSGQKLDEGIIDKIKETKNLCPELPVEVDIGVNFETAPKLAAAGADFLVATSVLNNAPDYYLAFEKLAKLASKTP